MLTPAGPSVDSTFQSYLMLSYGGHLREVRGFCAIAGKASYMLVTGVVVKTGPPDFETLSLSLSRGIGSRPHPNHESDKPLQWSLKTLVVRPEYSVPLGELILLSKDVNCRGNAFRRSKSE